MTNRDEESLSDEQRNELVFADVNDSSAWGDPIAVGPSKGPRRIRQAKHLELASKFYVLSILHRLGADATLTFSESDNVDLRVVLESGDVLTAEVKALTGPPEWSVAEFRARARHFVTLVWYSAAAQPTTPPQVYIVASEQLRAFIAGQGETTVSLEALNEEVHALEAWEQLAVSSAA